MEEKSSLGYASGSVGLAMIALAPRENGIYLLISLLVNSLFSSAPAAQALLSDLTDMSSRGKVIAINGLLERNAAGFMSAVGGVLYNTVEQLTFAISVVLLVPIVFAAGNCCHIGNAIAAASAFVNAVYSVGKMMPWELRCTVIGGLAICPSAMKFMPKIE